MSFESYITSTHWLNAAELIVLLLAGFHAAAAFYHQFVRKDHTLKAMLPFGG